MRESLRRLSLQNPVLPSFSQNENIKPEINPIKTILIRKAEAFGVSVNITDSVGVVITSITPGSSSSLDGRLQAGDVLVALNNQSLVDVEPRRVGEILRSVDKSSSDVLVQYIAADNAPEQVIMHPADPIRHLLRSQTKSDEEEDEYFDVSESEPPKLPTSPPPTLLSEVLSKSLMQEDNTMHVAPPVVTTKPTTLPKMEETSSTKILLPKISPIILPAKPSVPSPKPMIRVTPTDGTSKGVDSMVSKVKPTVPFKPVRTSLSPKDALPNRATKSKHTTIENLVGESTPSGLSRQWGPQRTVELFRDPDKGLGISIISGKVDTLHGGIFIKNVLADSPAGWNGTLKRGDRILEVNGEDIRTAGHSKAVDVIKNATNPVKFVIQSLVPLPKKVEVEAPAISSDPSSPTEKSTVKPDASSPAAKITPVQPPVSVSLNPGTPSASSSNSSSRESTIKRSSSKDVPPSPSDEKTTSAKATEAAPSSADVEAPAKVETSVDEELPQPSDDVIAEVLAKGKVLTKKGKQIDVSSAGNLKLTPTEKAEDPESEDEFGYTNSKSP